MIAVVDFGSQTAHLISRRIKELGVKTEIISPSESFKKIKELKPSGIILSGGPASVYEKGAPSIDPRIYSLNIPILGICYGFMITSKLLGGKVVSGKKEYGPATLAITNGKTPIADKLLKKSTVWMSHGDEIVKLPKGFEIIGSTSSVPFAFVENKSRKIFGVLFHPEVEHTEIGNQFLENFVKVSKAQRDFVKKEVGEIIQEIKSKVGDFCVIGAVSGGVDSTVAGVLVSKAIGGRFLPVFVDNGLMREGTRKHVEWIFKRYKTKVIVVDAKTETLRKLKGVSDPEKKRKIIGKFYIEIFEKEMKKLVMKEIKIKFLMQGTIYSDVIESKGTKHADKIKSHHNVGGLPKKMNLKLLEPLRELYKDEVRKIGTMVGLPEEFVQKQPFPGPGYAIRIRGEVTKERLEKEKVADKIILEELGKVIDMKTIYMSFPIMTGAYSTAVKGDGRSFSEVVALRIIESRDVMTTTWAKIPYDVLQKISSRIVNEVPNVSRVVYDITTKPPATMEWE